MPQNFLLNFCSSKTNFHSQLAKILASSLLRSLFSGKVNIFNADFRVPLFKIERSRCDEILLESMHEDGSLRDYIVTLAAHAMDSQICSDDWLIATNSPLVALRNIDHLIPSDTSSSHPSNGVDFYWLPDVGNRQEISSHFWAVRAKHLPMLLEHWESMWSSKDENHYNESQMWSEMIKSLPLKKKPFEKGEIYCPEVGAVDWDAITKAAIVMVPNWPEKMQWSFLQSLYFGTYFGDETGLMLNLLDA